MKEAQAYAEDTGLLFMETSAKTAMNVNELFLAIGEIFTLFIYLNCHGLLLVFLRIFFFLLCCSKKDAQNRHPEPDPRGATSRRQPPGPGRSLHPSLLRGELDGCTLHLPPLTPSLFSCKPMHRGGPDPPAPRMLHQPPVQATTETQRILVSSWNWRTETCI